MTTDVAQLPRVELVSSDEAHARYAELRPSRLAQGPSGLLSFLHYDDVHTILCDRT